MKLPRLITRQPTRTTIWRGLISLLLGYVLTVAVAWACTLQSKANARTTSQSAGHFPQPELLFFEDLRPKSWPGLSTMNEFEGFGFYEQTASGTKYVFGGSVPRTPNYFMDGEVLIRKRYSGFPWHSMYNANWSAHNLRAWEDESGVIQLEEPEMRLLERGFVIPSWVPHMRSRDILPLRPLWPGALYSVLSCGLLIFPMVCLVEYGWRHRHFRVDYRRKHGQCLKCKYPLGDFANCPECGNQTGRKP